MRKNIYTAPVTEILIPWLDPIQYETVPVFWSTENENPIESNGGFFDDDDDDELDSFFDD